MNAERLEEIIARFASIRIAVIGDFFLDRYLDIDRSIAEISLETNLEAHQVVGVRNYPGAAGTVMNNLCAFGIGKLFAVGAIGDDGEGYELRRAFEAAGVDLQHLIRSDAIRTPTYTKPMLEEPGAAPRELERLDIKNRVPLPESIEQVFLASLPGIFNSVDGVIVCDQVDEPELGVINHRIRSALNELAAQHPEMPILADSRGSIGLFKNAITKPNRREALISAGLDENSDSDEDLAAAGRAMAQRTGRPVFATSDACGIFVFADETGEFVPAYKPQGEIDIVGAGDSVAAALVTALCAGATPQEAALLGNLAASITIEQLGVTGTPPPESLRQRLKEYNAQQQ